jgi:phospholipid-binding lipoprotein MlaA
LRRAAVTVLFGMGVLVAGPACAQPPAAGSPDDPYEASNRQMYAVEDGLDHGILLPLAKLYHFLTPGPIGKGIHNVLSNLSEPVVIINDVLQGRLKRAGRETLRMTANTTAGFLGLMDVATPAGLQREDTDFGITLGRWGVKPGPYLYLPLIGPTTPRDMFGLGADTAMDPLNFIDYPDRVAVAVSKTVAGGLDLRDRSQAQLDALLSDAADPYATLRSVYLQSREAAVEEQEGAPALAPIDDSPSSQATPPKAAEPASAAARDAAAGAAPPPPAVAAATTPAPPLDPIAAAEHPDPDAPVVTARDWRPALAAGAPGGSAA